MEQQLVLRPKVMAKTKFIGKDATKAGKDAQTPKANTKGLAQEVATKADKKSKKVNKEPTPDTSSEVSASSDEESSTSSSSSDEESKAKAVKPSKANGVKTNGAAKASALKASDSSASSEGSDSSEASSSSDEEDEPAAEEEGSSSEDSSEESESDKEAVQGAVDSKALQGKLEKVASNEVSSDGESDSEESSDSSSSSSSSDSESGKEEPSALVSKKRKAEVEEPAASAKKSSAEGDQTGNLFVGNLSWHVDEEWLKTEFEQFGELSSVRIVTDKNSGRSKGFGYVEFVKPEDASKALKEMTGKQLDGRPLNIDTANKRSEGADNSNKRQKTFGDSVSEPSETIFVANIAFDADEDMVGQAFGEHGTVTAVRLPKDIETGQAKGYGYVQFASLDEATAAMEAMKGATIAGRPIRLDYASSKPSNGGGRGLFRPGGRGGRGGGFDRGGRGGGRGRGSFDRGGRGRGRGGRGGSTNRGGFGDFQGTKTTY